MSTNLFFFEDQHISAQFSEDGTDVIDYVCNNDFIVLMAALIISSVRE